MIYADKAATTKMSGAAINAMLNCMEETWGNPSILYGLGQQAKEALEEARERICLLEPSPRGSECCTPGRGFLMLRKLP